MRKLAGALAIRSGPVCRALQAGYGSGGMMKGAFPIHTVGRSRSYRLAGPAPCLSAPLAPGPLSCGAAGARQERALVRYAVLPWSEPALS